MTICYFGIYDPGYSRNRVFIKGLRQNGVEVIECNSRRRGLFKYLDLFRQHWRLRKKYQVMVVGFPGYQAMLLARILTRRPIIFDTLSSFYDSMIIDRGVAKLGSLVAAYYWILDWLACRLADKVILDTSAQIDYFVKTFGIRREKMHRIFIGSDDEAVYPLKKVDSGGSFLVHFHGAFNPLQGIEFIIKAAKLLENKDIKFNIVGKGQTYKEIRKMACDLEVINVNFIDPVGYGELKEYMAQADICLGIFGRTEKAQQVIPNKVYEALAAGRAVITGETPAIKELLTNKENVLFCNMADSEDLANKTLELKNNNDFRLRIAEKGYNLFKSQLRPVILGKQLVGLINEII